MSVMETVSGYPPLARQEAVTAALSDVRLTSSSMANSNLFKRAAHYSAMKVNGLFIYLFNTPDGRKQ